MTRIYHSIVILLLIQITGCSNNLIVSDNQINPTDLVKAEPLPEHFRLISYSASKDETDTSFADLKRQRDGHYRVQITDGDEQMQLIAGLYELSEPNYLVEFRAAGDADSLFYYFPVRVTKTSGREYGILGLYEVDYKKLSEAMNLPSASKLKQKDEYSAFAINGRDDDIIMLSGTAAQTQSRAAFSIFDLNDRLQALEVKALLAERRANKATRAADAAKRRAQELSAKQQPAAGNGTKNASRQKLSPAGSQGNWVFTDKSRGSKKRLYLSIAQSSSTSATGKSVLVVACTNNGLGIEILWGVPLKNMYPHESVPTATRVLAQFGNSAVWDMAWQPSPDATVTRPPRIQLDVASSIDSAIFSLLGMDSISKKNKEMFNWTADQFINRLAGQAQGKAGLRELRLRATSRRNDNLTLEFDLTGFNEIASEKFAGVCTG